MPESEIGASLPKAGIYDLRLDILGKKLSITAGGDPAYLNEVKNQYKDAVANTQGISQKKDPLEIAIITGFMLCDHVNKLKQQIRREQANAEAKRADEEKELNRITGNLIACLDQALEITDFNE